MSDRPMTGLDDTGELITDAVWSLLGVLTLGRSDEWRLELDDEERE